LESIRIVQLTAKPESFYESATIWKMLFGATKRTNFKATG